MIERNFDVPFVAQLAKREKQIQQSYRPVIGVHKWFARRAGSLFRALLLAEFTNGVPLSTSFFSNHRLNPLIIGDPFMVGGTPLLEANRLGCHVVGADVNPMAHWVVRQELAELDRAAFRATAQQVMADVEAQVAHLYQTTCTYCENPHAKVKYFLWVKQRSCAACNKKINLFTKYLVAKNQRHPNYVLVCPTCGSLNELCNLKNISQKGCQTCREQLLLNGPAHRNVCTCPYCGHRNSYPEANNGVPEHELFGIEYHCSLCKPTHRGRFFKAPDAIDRAHIIEAQSLLQDSSQKWIPTDAIPPGDETARLHRWGYQTYRELFNPRQLLGLNLLAERIASVKNEVIREALLTVFSDTLRYQNMLCRYDTYALKIIDIFSVHGFPVSLIQCENSLLGIPKIGSGGFRHFVKKYDRAKEYCEKPFEMYLGRSRKKIYLSQEQINGSLVSHFPEPNASKFAYLQAKSSEKMALPPASLDAVLTDPPYFANVQYAELMDFCYVWLKKHLADRHPSFREASTRTMAELTVNQTEGRDITHFAEGLSQIFRTFTQALKAGAPFAFTYHHNKVDAYLPIAVALLDASLVCTATLPCPAEMSASIHIRGTRSSVVDTIFVCRTTGSVPPNDFEATWQNLKRMLKVDLEQLEQANTKPALGNARCLLLAHLTRLAIWQLRSTWCPKRPIRDKLSQVEAKMLQIFPLNRLDRRVNEVLCSLSEEDLLAHRHVKEGQEIYHERAELSF